MRKLFALTLVLSVYTMPSLIGQTAKSSSSEILHELKKLQNPTRVLYLAAHPDDENTRMISYLVNEVGANTAYLSLTRGDGGQNLIGKELSAELGILRTQELMQARAIDGGQQFFTRAVDFGYSKTSKETLEKWGEQEVLSDVVWVIRKFRPDVIVTRFPPDSRGGHGHHTASAELGIKAFELAGDAKAFPNQLEFVETWQPKRIYWNASSWWNRDIAKKAADNPDYVVINVGGYSPILGMSSNELASLSRTQHKSQGFGVSVARGGQKEYLQHLAGDKAVESLFSDVDQSWKRYDFNNGNDLLAKIISAFDPAKPYKSIEALVALKKASASINHDGEKKRFQSKVDQIILSCMGFHAEVLANREFLLADDSVTINLELLNRSPMDLSVKEVLINGSKATINEELSNNADFEQDIDINTFNLPWSQPYWIMADYGNLYPVGEQQLIGNPENGPALFATISISLDGLKSGKELLKVNVPVTHKYSDRVDGEIIKPTFIVPEVAVLPSEKQILFLDGSAQQLELEVQFQNAKEVTLSFIAEGFDVSPAQLLISPASEKDLSAKTIITITPNGKGGASENLRIDVNDEPAQALYRIDYPHIDERIVIKQATVGLKTIDLKKQGDYVGYILGAGDEVPEAIRQMGYEVVILDENAIRSQDLSNLKAIVAGIRAYNTQEWLPGVKTELMNYVENGGNYIIQYNTASRDLLSLDLGPYPFKITRNRVTEEDAEAKFLKPDHAVLNKPNKLTQVDFEDWVQERGLYFAGEWDKKYQTPIGWHDDGEDLQKGALLIADHGKGAFMYTGISFFRELPAGVSGAYRLLANLISYENTASDNEQ